MSAETIQLKKTTAEDLCLLWEMQKKAFAQLYEKYRDTEISPAAEELDKIIRRFNQGYS